MSNAKTMLLGLLVVTLLACCKEDSELKDPLDLSDIGITFDLGFDKTYIVLESEEELNQALSEIDEEIDYLFKEEEVMQVNYSITLENGKYALYGISVIESNGQIAYSPAEEDLSEGWNTVKLCATEKCVSEAVAGEFAKIESVHDCMRVQVSRGRKSARVCSQDCTPK